MEPSVSEDTLSLLWYSSITSTSPTTALNATTTAQGAYQNWFICNDDTIFLNDIVETTYNRSQLLRTTDFGGIWDVVTQPHDDLWDSFDPAGYATIYSRSRCHRMFFMQNGSLAVASGYTGGQAYSCFTSGDLGTTWTLRTSGVAYSLYTPTDPCGKYTAVKGNAFTCGHNSDKSRILVGGRPSWASTGAGYMILPPGHTDSPSSSTPNDDVVTVATNVGGSSPDSNTYSITQVNDWVYQTGDSGSEAIWATNHSAAQGGYRVATIYYGGSPADWRATYTGSWRVTGFGGGAWSLNGWYVTSALGFNWYSWQTNGSALLIPASFYSMNGHASFGHYYSMEDEIPTDIDYTSLVVPVDPADSTNKFAFKVFYVSSIRRWVMVYSFYRASFTDPRWMYMRVGGTGFQPSDFGSPQKLNFPTNWELRGNGNGAVHIDYSVTQNKWIISTFMTNRTPSPDIYLAALWTVEDSFYCPV